MSEPAPKKQVSEPAPKKKSTSLWVSSTYFAEGLPYMIVRWMSGVYVTDIGVKESVIGYLNLLGVPWNFKFLWAPLVDFYSTRRRWLLGVELVLSVLMFILAWLVSHGPAGQGLNGGASQPVTALSWEELQGAIDPAFGLSHATILLMIIGLFVVMAFAAATNDVAIDAYYIEGIPDRGEQAAYSGLRVFSYRVAVIFVRTALIAFSSWAWGFAVGAATMLAVFLFHLWQAPRFPSDVAKPVPERPNFIAHFARAFAAFLQQDRVGIVLAFVITYKFGDEIMFSMNTPFLVRELGINKGQLAWIGGIVGMVSTILGAIVGGWLIKKYGFKKAVWPLTLVMNLTIWVYVLLAMYKPSPTDDLGLFSIALAHGYEYFTAGLGNAVITVFLLYTCKPEFKAAHYAIGSALMSVPGNFLGGFAGKFVENFGYVNLYVVAFAASFPSMLLLSRLPLDTMLSRRD